MGGPAPPFPSLQSASSHPRISAVVASCYLSFPWISICSLFQPPHYCVSSPRSPGICRSLYVFFRSRSLQPELSVDGSSTSLPLINGGLPDIASGSFLPPPYRDGNLAPLPRYERFPKHCIKPPPVRARRNSFLESMRFSIRLFPSPPLSIARPFKRNLLFFPRMHSRIFGILNRTLFFLFVKDCRHPSFLLTLFFAEITIGPQLPLSGRIRTTPFFFSID